jgi:ketosteroid isomerase-like protein
MRPDMADNVGVVQSAYAAFGRGDIAALVDLLDDAVRWSSPRTLPQGGEFTGKDGVQQFFASVGAAWETLEIEVESLGEVGADLVVAIVHATGSLRDKGPARYGAAHVFTVNDGRMTSFREFVDVDDALAS